MAVVCAFVPLADHIGFELAGSLTIANAFMAAFAGIAAMRLEMEKPVEARRPASAATRGGLFAIAALLLPTGLILLNGLRRPICEPVAGSLWLLLLPAPTAWLSATVGALARTRFMTTTRAYLATLLVILVTSGFTVYTTYAGPPAFALDHFGGYFVDFTRGASIPIGTALLSFRAATILWGIAAVAAAGFLASEDAERRRMHARWLAASSAIVIVGSIGWGSKLGWRTTDRSLRAALAGEMRVGNVVIHYPRSLAERSTELLMRDVVFVSTELERALGVSITHPIHVWMYESAAEQRRLAGFTVPFTKPYRHEIHISPAGYPHPSLRHELTHAIGAELAGGLWGTPGRVIPNAVLVEGFAVAYEIDDESTPLAQRARGMRDLGIAPDLARMLRPGGFEAEATSRAYDYSGAFIRYLSGRFPKAKMRELYGSGDLAVLGDPSSLVRDFERSLDSVHVGGADSTYAARVFARPPISRQRCPREVRALVDTANARFFDRRYEDGLAILDRACALEPNDPDLINAKLSFALSMREPTLDRVLRIAEELWTHPRLHPALEASSRVTVADEMMRRGDTARARPLYVRAASIPNPVSRRGAYLRLRALDDPVFAAAYFPPLIGGASTMTGTLLAVEATARRPNDALLWYIASFRARSAPDRAIDLGLRADALGVPDPDIARDNLRWLVTALADRNRCDDTEAARTRLRAVGGSAADDATAADWVARCRFAVARGWKPI